MWLVKLRQLQHFVAVAETLSFRRAAERVNLTQQAVSKSLLQLEAQLGVRLLERSHQSVILTPAGRELLPFALEVLSASRRFDEAVASATDPATGSLAIGASPTFLESIVPDALNRFQQSYPATPVTVERGDFSTLCAMMLRGELDLVLSTAPDDVPRHLVHAVTMGRDRNVIVVRAGHPLLRLASVTCADLAGYPLISTINYPRGKAYLERLFLGVGLAPPRPLLTVGSTLLGIERVENTDSWWVTPQMQVDRRLACGAFVALAVKPQDSSWELIMTTRRHAVPSRWAQEFAGQVRECLRSSATLLADS